LFTGTFDALDNIGSRLNSATGGLFANLGEQPGDFTGDNIEAAFDAITVQTFSLKDCEFDFYSEAPSYLDLVSVKDIPEATNKFKIKVGKIEKTTGYNFYEYLISEYVRNTRITSSALSQVNSGYLPTGADALGEPYVEDGRSPSTATSPASKMGERAISYGGEEALHPTEGDAKTALTDAVVSRRLAEDDLRRTPLERALGGVIRNFSNALNQGINAGLGELTGGLLGTQPLGNVFGDPAIIQQASNALNDFLTPGNQLPDGNQNNTPPSQILKNIQFEALNIDRVLDDTNVFGDTPPPSPGSIGDANVFE
jgi:hypothetical protein